MKEIKCKVWNPRLKQMSEAFMWKHLLGAEVRLLHKSNIDDPLKWLLFTGRHDQQQTEIYEDDILYFSVYAAYGRVYWDDEYSGWMVHLYNIPECYKTVGSLFDFLTSVGWKDSYRVAGNYWENPELLEAAP